MFTFKKKCSQCYGDGTVVHPVEPKLVKCKKCKGKGKVWRKLK